MVTGESHRPLKSSSGDDRVDAVEAEDDEEETDDIESDC